MVALVKRKQDKFQAFYTSCKYITNYMVGLLDCKAGMSVLEPCAGDGAFIDEIIRRKCDANISAFDINDQSISSLTQKYINANNINIQKADFAFIESLNSYDRIIANPPYGAYQTPEKRDKLKATYPGIYAKETYGIFLIRAMEMLKPNGRVVFIVPDTFLTLHLHERLRNQLLLNYKIESITLFPSKFFPGVNFGYAGLCIISIRKAIPSSNWKFPIYKGFTCPQEFEDLLTNQKSKFEVGEFSYEKLKTNPSKSFYISTEPWVEELLERNLPTIESICHVVTGFYSGNDAHYLRRSEVITRGVKKYQPIDMNLVWFGDRLSKPPLDGFEGEKHWIPIVKGGNRRFHKSSEWFMDWSRAAIHDYKVINKKKARFQNSQFYFNQGIAVPMVSSSAITGALIDGRLFDQSIVGVFPKHGQEHLLMYLLGFFNSKTCNDLIRTINISTNNSSNYIKKIPILVPNNNIIYEVVNLVSQLCDLANQREILESDLQQLNIAFDIIYGVKST
ncbi:Eco57I restriction-modification methylase domain-containing protein [Chamaesiphon sp.]|uniref:Eco57I restriction-modification methylase domain-containing protein n=1 Tax=Chamaesiphon sp. TaxID=2814140 RepID=UPI0035945E64